MGAAPRYEESVLIASSVLCEKEEINSELRKALDHGAWSKTEWMCM